MKTNCGTRCGAVFYHALPYLYASICILELISSIVLLVMLTRSTNLIDEDVTTTPITTPGETTLTTTSRKSITTTTPTSSEIIIKLIIAYSISLAGSIIPVFTGIILFFSIFTCCVCLRKNECRRPFLRFVSLNCNCPCYIPRPKLRFAIRIGFHLFCIALRVVGIIMYRILSDEAPEGRKILQILLLVTAVCLIFPLLTILLDVYHYRVWWAYEPIIDIPPDIARKAFSKKHKRFIPYVLTERFRTDAIGNRKCKYDDACERRQLDHVVIFHSSKHQPQPRWSEEYPIYIGFHRTKPEAAYSIAKSEFAPSSKGMLGPGAYFARSTDATLSKIGKSDQTGAWFVAEISMGKVFMVNEQSIRKYPNNKRFDANLERFVRNGDWSTEYDTCYFKHHTESKDEFCIKDPANQILRWVVVIEEPYDKKLDLYGLANELDRGSFSCC